MRWTHPAPPAAVHIPSILTAGRILCVRPPWGGGRVGTAAKPDTHPGPRQGSLMATQERKPSKGEAANEGRTPPGGDWFRRATVPTKANRHPRGDWFRRATAPTKANRHPRGDWFRRTPAATKPYGNPEETGSKGDGANEGKPPPEGRLVSKDPRSNEAVRESEEVGIEFRLRERTAQPDGDRGKASLRQPKAGRGPWGRWAPWLP